MLGNDRLERIADVGDCIDSFSEIMDSSEVAQFLKLGEEAVRRAMRAGQIPATKVCGQWRSKKSDLLAMFESE